MSQDRAALRAAQSRITAAPVDLETRLMIQSDLELLENLLAIAEVHDTAAASCQIAMWRAKRAKIGEWIAARTAS